MLQSNYRRAAETLLQSTYMDDSMDSVVNEIEGISLYKQLSELWEKAGMLILKQFFRSNTSPRQSISWMRIVQ